MQIFSEVTLQMSMESVPTLPFVLPLYLSMETKLKSYAIRPDNEPRDTSVPWKIRAAAKVALEKLYKYKRLADNNQFYTIATGKQPFRILTYPRGSVTRLSPYLRSSSSLLALYVVPEDGNNTTRAEGRNQEG